MRLAPAFRSASLVALAILIAAGCDTGDGPSLYNPDRTSLPDPVVTEIVTDAPIVLAGIDVITLNGSNFSTTPSDNRVYFGDAVGETLEATATQLRVRVPNAPGEDFPVRVTVIGAEQFSDPVALSLVPAFEKVSEFAQTEEAFGGAVDASGNLFISLTAEGLSSGVQRIAPDGSRTVWFDASSATWSDLAVSSSGDVYGARGIRALFRLPQGQSQQTFVVLPSGVSLSTIDFDDGGNLWAGGNTTAIYRIAPDGTPTPFPYTGNVRSLDVVGTSLYAAVTLDNVSRVVRFSINGGALGDPVEILNVTEFSGRRATAVAVAASGGIYVGTSDQEPTTADLDPILYVSPAGEPSTLYPGVLSGAVTSLSYGAGTGLYFARAPSTATALTPATPGDLLRVETREPGSP